MAADGEFLTYEHVLQELQTNRGQLNQFIRSGRLKQHVVEGETRFKKDEVLELKAELEKEPTVMEDWEESTDERGTAMLDDSGIMPAEPGTKILEDEDLAVRRTTDVLEESSATGEPDTVVLEEGEDDDELGILGGGDIELERPTGFAKPGDSALETELDLAAVRSTPQSGQQAEPEEEDFFDFSGDLEDAEFELEKADASGSSELQQTGDMVVEPESEDVVTEILDLGGGDEVGEEDLLSEIMEIEEDLPQEEPSEDSADITAEITTMEEPTYEESDLDELLEAEEDVGQIEEGFAAAGEEFEVPYAAPVEGPATVGPAFVAMLVVTLLILVLAGLFVVENATPPDISTHLTNWASPLFGPKG